jgi:ribosomal protein S18 acetylase RimI-like enzyme
VPHRSRVEYVSDELLSRFGREGLEAVPMGADYVYDVGRMIDLAGGDLASKRQAKNRFLRNYEHRVEPYDPAVHLGDCRRLLDQWKTHQDDHHAAGPEADTNAVKRHKESVATQLCLESAGRLGLRGLVVYVKEAGQWALKGFTFGESLGRDQSSITIEKTDLAVKGLAQFIFSEFCRTSWADRPFVNVGDDWGLETLAWTKMSYRPAKMLHKYLLRRPAVTSVAVAPAARPFVVRAAKRDDLSAAVALERTCFGDGGFSLTKRQLQYLYRRPTAVFLVAEQGGEVVAEGVALVRQHKRGLSGRIYSLAVCPDSRGQGIGEALVRALVEELTSRGVRRTYLEVETTNAGATGLYERLGFERIGTLSDYYGPGRPAIHMVYTAAAPVALVA